MANYLLKPSLFPRAIMLLALILSCVLLSHAEAVSSTPADWGYENTVEVTSVTIGDFTLTFSSGSGSNAPRYYAPDKTMRFYVGNTVTVTSSNRLYIPTKFGDHELTDGTYSFTTKEKFTVVTIAYEAKGVVVDNLFYSFDGSIATVTGCWDSVTNLNIPSEVEYEGQTYSVTSIGDSAFEDCIGLTSVIIPSSVTSIGSSAFEGCTGLIKSAYPNSISNPFSNGFAISYPATNSLIEGGVIWSSDKTKLYFVPIDFQGGFTIPNSVTSIEDYAFQKCTELTSVTIPNSVTSIGDYAFRWCSGLTSVIIPNSVTSIGRAVFLFCNSLIKSAYPNSISNPFSYELAALEPSGVSVPYPIDALFEDGIIWSSDKTELYFVPFDFQGEFTISNSVTSIGDWAFCYCTGLTSVTIPNSVTSIGNGAFQSCSGLTSIIIPTSVTSIGNDAFLYCNSLIKCAYPESIENPFSSGAVVSYSETNALFEDDIIWSLDKTELYFVPIDFQGEFTIPNSVTLIGSGSFYGCTELTSVTIPNSVTSICDYAFSGCTGLSSVTIPGSVTSIGISAFSKCTGLQWIESKATIPPTIKKSAFSDYDVPLIAASENYKTADYWKKFTNVSVEYTPTGRTFEVNGLKYEIISIDGLTCRLYGIDESVEGDVVIPSTVTYREREFTPIEISGILIKGKTPITSLSIPSNISTLTSGCVLDASLAKLTVNTFVTDNLMARSAIDELVIAPSANINNGLMSNTVRKLTIEDGESALNTWQFKCSGMKEVYLGRTLSSWHTFSGITSLENVYISDNVTSIEDYTFYGCTGLTEVTIPNSVTSIGDNAFRFCTGLTSVTIGNSVASIGEYAFSGCTGLTAVTIPKSVTSIENDAFYDCSGVNELNIADSETELTIGSKAFADVKPTKAYLGRNISSTIFTDNANLSDLTIGGEVAAINDFEFKGCTALSAVTILANNISKLGSSAFNGCTGLTAFAIPSSVTSIGESAFSGCTSITELNINESETELTIGSDAFSNVKPTKAYLGRNISSAIFTDNTNLSNLTIGGKVAAINDSEFKGCIALAELSLPNSVTKIGSSAFEDCTAITELLLPNSVTSIGASVFSGCSGLTSATIPNSVTSIGASAFAGCYAITALDIPNSVTSIGVSAFSDCTSIAEMRFDDGASGLVFDGDAFRNVAPTKIYFGRQMDFSEAPVSALETVEFGENVTYIKTEAFKVSKSLLNVTSRNTIPPTTEDPFNDDTYFDGTLYVPATSIGTYKAAAGWKNFWEIKDLNDISTGVSEIGDNSNAPFSVENGAICVDGDADVRIVSMSGTTVYSGRGETRINLPPGIYIVITNNTSTKVAVK